VTIRPLDDIKNHAFEGPLGVSTAHFYDELLSKVSEEEQWKFHGVEAPPRNTFIIPPSINKFGNPNIPEELSQVWSAMRRALVIARRVLMIGYSFPPADLEFNTLFRLSMMNNSVKNAHIQIVDPDQTLADRIRQMTPSIGVERIANTLKEYVE
jgi:hypothetical protein